MLGLGHVPKVSLHATSTSVLQPTVSIDKALLRLLPVWMQVDHTLLRSTFVPTTYCAQDPLFARQVPLVLDPPFVMRPAGPAAVMQFFTSATGQAPATESVQLPS